MKFLVLALCVCAASAATFDFKPYKPYQPEQKFQGFRPASPIGVAKTTYDAAKFVATAPVVAAKVAYDTVAVAPVVGAKSVYSASPVVEVSPVVAKPFYEAAPVVTAPVASVKAVYDSARVVAVAPAVAARTVYNTGKEYDAGILRSESVITPEGYNYAYKTANGIAAQSSGVLKASESGSALAIQGSYEYTAPDGTPVKLEYVADENGYQPRSNLLPVAPPVPADIARAVAYILANPPKSEKY